MLSLISGVAGSGRMRRVHGSTDATPPPPLGWCPAGVAQNALAEFCQLVPEPGNPVCAGGEDQSLSCRLSALASQVGELVLI